MRVWLIRYLGGYPTKVDALLEATANDFLDYVGDLPLVERRKVLADAVRHLFRAVGEEEIFQQRKDGAWTFQGKVLPIEQVDLLRAEANQIRTSRLWKSLSLELRYQAMRKLYTQAETSDHIDAAQLAMYYVSIIESRL